jgi:hypothetical protein
MPVSIRELSPGDAEGIRAFNARLAQAGVSFSFPTEPGELMQREPDEVVPFQTAYLLADTTGVRGGYILKSEQLFARGEAFSAANYQLPLSEGIIDRRYALVGIQLIKDALLRQSHLYCLGMGSATRPLPQLLSKLGWTVSRVPFLFRVQNARNFAREIIWLRKRKALRLALDISRVTGMLSGAVAMARLRQRVFMRALPRDASVSEVAELPQDIDELFARVRSDYGLLSDRRALAMRKKLPPQDPRLVRLLLHRAGGLAGWVVVSRSRLSNHTQFGNMSLGCIVDGLAAPVNVGPLVSAACARLEQTGCDLIVSNQSHPAWIRALRSNGFVQGPSNFILALSPPLAAAGAAVAVSHFNRADGDGPINL